MAKNITKRQAEAAQRAVQAWFVAGGWDGVEVTLHAPGRLSSGWAVLAEDGPDDWTFRAGDRAGISSAVFVEPVSPWVLGLYPA
jgi:hypothetical protein